MKRHFSIVGFSIFLAVTDGRAAPAPNGYNVLFIAVDDLRTELGCYGLDYVQSSNIDRLASQSTLFTNHHVQVPTCGSSRFSMLTGRSPLNSQVSDGNEVLYQGPTALKQESLAGAQSLPEQFRRSGYHTVCIGKVSHTADGRVYSYKGQGDGRPELPHAWDELATPLGSWQRGWGVFFAYANGKHREDGQGHRALMEFIAEKDEDLPDGQMAARAIEQLGALKKNGKPFFLGLGFFKPHLPFVAPKSDWDAMEKVNVPPPPHSDKPTSGYTGKSAEFFGYKSTFQKSRPLTPEDHLAARRAYLTCVRYTDRQVGKVLDSLDSLGLSENTIVVLWGDHGWHLGDSQIWGKHTSFERSLHSPLIVRAPNISRPGVRCDALVETIDIYPTLVDLCQPTFKKTHFPLDGISLRGLLDGSAQTVRDTSLSYWENAVTVRTLTHQLIATRTASGWEKMELYDMRKTPDPVENVISSQPELAALLQAKLPKIDSKKGRGMAE